MKNETNLHKFSECVESKSFEFTSLCVWWERSDGSRLLLNKCNSMMKLNQLTETIFLSFAVTSAALAVVLCGFCCSFHSLHYSTQITSLSSTVKLIQITRFECIFRVINRMEFCLHVGVFTVRVDTSKRNNLPLSFVLNSFWVLLKHWVFYLMSLLLSGCLFVWYCYCCSN